jgi:hypothetical protein
MGACYELTNPISGIQNENLIFEFSMKNGK